jgi:hypothetical protein
LDSIGWSGTGQWALDRPHVLYVPAGTYRITQTLRFKYRISVSLLGEDPAMTILVWDGPADQPMLHCNGMAYHKVSRFTLDGCGRALSAVDHKWDGTNQPHATSGSEYSDLIIRDVAYGIRAGVANNDAEVVVVRCRFLRCSGAGISMESYNALDWFAWYCEFDECREGVTEGYAGACHVYCCLFRDSIETDTRIGNCVGYFSYRHNTSVNSKAFFAADSFTMCPGNVTLQGNTIIDPRAATCSSWATVTFTAPC